MPNIPTFQSSVAAEATAPAPGQSPERIAAFSPGGDIARLGGQIMDLAVEMKHRKDILDRQREVYSLNTEMDAKFGGLMQDAAKMDPSQSAGFFQKGAALIQKDLNDRVNDEQVKMSVMNDFRQSALSYAAHVEKDANRRRVDAYRAQLEEALPVMQGQYVQALADGNATLIQGIEDRFGSFLDAGVESGVLSQEEAAKNSQLLVNGAQEGFVNTLINAKTPDKSLIALRKDLDNPQFLPGVDIKSRPVYKREIEAELRRRGNERESLAKKELEQQNKALFEQVQLDRVQKRIDFGAQSGITMSPDGRADFQIGDQTKSVRDQAMVDLYYTQRILPLNQEDKATAFQKLVENTSIIPSQIKNDIIGKIIGGTDADKISAADSLTELKRLSPIGVQDAFAGDEGKNALRFAEYVDYANQTGISPQNIIAQFSPQNKEIVQERDRMAHGDEFVKTSMKIFANNLGLGFDKKTNVTSLKIAEKNIPQGMLNQFLFEAQNNYRTGGLASPSIDFAMKDVMARWSNSSIGSPGRNPRWMQYAPDTFPDFHRPEIDVAGALGDNFEADIADTAKSLGVLSTNIFFDADVETPHSKTWPVFYLTKDGYVAPLLDANSQQIRWQPSQDYLNKEQQKQDSAWKFILKRQPPL